MALSLSHEENPSPARNLCRLRLRLRIALPPPCAATSSTTSPAPSPPRSSLLAELQPCATPSSLTTYLLLWRRSTGPVAAPGGDPVPTVPRRTTWGRSLQPCLLGSCDGWSGAASPPHATSSPLPPSPMISAAAATLPHEQVFSVLVLSKKKREDRVDLGDGSRATSPERGFSSRTARRMGEEDVVHRATRLPGAGERRRGRLTRTARLLLTTAAIGH